MSFQRLQNGHVRDSLGGKIDEYLDHRELPMYKDKPYNYSASSKTKPIYKRWRTIAGIALATVTLLYWLGSSNSTDSKPHAKPNKSGSWGWSNKKLGIDWNSRREEVKETFVYSWNGYEQYAWGFDQYRPLSKDGAQMNEQGKGLGWIIVDALDTMMIMNLTSQLSHAREWISTSLNYDQDYEVNTFETTIRMMGGLLSAHYLSNSFTDLANVKDDDKGAPGEDLYLEKATDLADRLMGAFDSPSGVPFASVNLQTSLGKGSHVDDGASSTAEASSLQLEFKYLAYLTGEKNYWEKAERVMEVIDDNGRQDGLLPIFIYPTTGTFMGENIRLGSRGDSYYEYLIKQYLQTEAEEPLYENMWSESLAGIRKHLITYSNTSHLTVLAERPSNLEGAISPKMDHLVCFMPGTIALATTGGVTVNEAKAAGKWNEQQESELRLARELTKTCYGMYKVMATGLAPEIAHFALSEPPHMESDGILESAELTDDPEAEWRKDYEIHHQDNHNLQRPETIETLFYMYRITGDEMYREWGWEIFQNFLKYSKADDNAGYTSLAHANEIPPIEKDNMESFWLAETLKYFYLLFSPPDFLPLTSVVFNTEAHIFPRFKLARGLQTGWERTPRDAQGVMQKAFKKSKTLIVQKPLQHETAPSSLPDEQKAGEGHVGLSG
ncbi:uncharacterized protein KY384_009105 [Bacidia gigantensis]|uniref:uncharacterized protein n=1 Tax=Bacidia gigantensis TaxID=2732470 RepID=UPI001D03B793|nr:uncharacterized protein KY384_009105 [Bacidia gigantensis]KAG8525461.1 hypothetical protein KY384_009105 [Bacidia gigantensis]